MLGNADEMIHIYLSIISIDWYVWHSDFKRWRITNRWYEWSTLGDRQLDGYGKKKYVCKLLFIFLLGVDIDFGYMEAVNLLSSIKYTEKQIVSVDRYMSMLLQTRWFYSNCITSLFPLVKADYYLINLAYCRPRYDWISNFTINPLLVVAERYSVKLSFINIYNKFWSILAQKQLLVELPCCPIDFQY